jgi:hypothetical protein
VRVFVVTHLFDPAESLYEKGADTTLFMRAPRQAGVPASKLIEGAPEPTAYGEDVYQRIFGDLPWRRQGVSVASLSALVTLL